MKLNELKTDRNAAEWVDCPELGFDEASGEAVALHVRSVNFPAYRIDLQQTRLRLARQYPGDQIVPPEVEDRENGRLLAKHLLIGWRGIEETFSPELALATLTDPEQRILREAVLASARVVGVRRAEQAKAIEGNSQPASDGH